MDFISHTQIPIIFLSHRIFPLFLQPSSQTKSNLKESQNQRKTKIQTDKEESCESSSVSIWNSLLFCLLSLLQLFHTMSPCFDSKPLSSAISLIVGSQWDSSWISCCCSVSWRSCCFGSVDSSPAHSLTVPRFCECWGGLAHSLVLCLVVAIWSAFLHVHYPEELSSTA